MNWIQNLSSHQPVAGAVVVIAIIVTLGLALGSLKIRGIGLGIAGVLFVGIFASHCGLSISSELLSFIRDFGLILFVYTIGMQVGPGFFTSLRRRGLPLNLLAAVVVLLGGMVTVILAWALHIDLAAAVGIFTGATTNTPALGAAQEALRSLPDFSADRHGLPAMGYAVAYPFGILGIILTMIGLRAVLKINLSRENSALLEEQKSTRDPLERRNFVVTNPNLNGLKLHQLPGKAQLGVIVSRIRYVGEREVLPADNGTVIHVHDVIHAVGTRQSLDEFGLIIGRETEEDLRKGPGLVIDKRFVVTNKEILGHTLRELGLTERFGVTVTRVTRADIEMTAVPDLQLQFGDMLRVVGTDDEITKVATVLGNSLKELSYTNLIPVFLGILVGVIVGLYPISLPGVPTPVRLGLAGGPLIVAILLSRIGRIGPLVWHMPANANVLLREFGIALFLACAGLKAGEHFFEVLLSSQGLLWLLIGACITLLPLLIVSLVARRLMKLNFVHLCGLLAGSMTDPPALAFANAVNKSDAPSVAYATVYPFTMLLRILVAQLIVLIFCR
jgi:putative transport protein